ncbi:hypothetical protein B6I21_05175 [candidate division KSB1 bacterium 4572_119]|nr:MAG: hypothetical protein B6I21_05175 [candidate division KSB1 bacterium 4572_119]
MKDRVMEIVMYIVDSMGSTTDDNIITQMHSLSEKLIKEGYSENEINTAFTLLLDTISEDEESGEMGTEQQISQLHDRNWSNLIKSNQKRTPLDFLYQMKELDVIGEEEIEQMLDQSLMQGKQGMCISEIKAIINGLIMSPKDYTVGSFFV